MSYSRWSNSDWYTYWSDSGTDDPELQKLAIHYSIDQSYYHEYRDLRDCKQPILQAIQEECGCSNESLRELEGYIDEFIEDVEASAKLRP